MLSGRREGLDHCRQPALPELAVLTAVRQCTDGASHESTNLTEIQLLYSEDDIECRVFSLTSDPALSWHVSGHFRSPSEVIGISLTGLTQKLA